MNKFGQSCVLDEVVQLALCIQTVTGHLYLTKFLHVAPIPVTFILNCVILFHEAAAKVSKEVDQQILPIIEAEISRTFDLPAHLCFVTVLVQHSSVLRVVLLLLFILFTFFKVESFDVRLFKGKVLVVGENELSQSQKCDSLASDI